LSKASQVSAIEDTYLSGYFSNDVLIFSCAIYKEIFYSFRFILVGDAGFYVAGAESIDACSIDEGAAEASSEDLPKLINQTTVIAVMAGDDESIRAENIQILVDENSATSGTEVVLSLPLGMSFTQGLEPVFSSTIGIEFGSIELTDTDEVEGDDTATTFVLTAALGTDLISVTDLDISYTGTGWDATDVSLSIDNMLDGVLVLNPVIAEYIEILSTPVTLRNLMVNFSNADADNRYVGNIIITIPAGTSAGDLMLELGEGGSLLAGEVTSWVLTDEATGFSNAVYVDEIVTLTLENDALIDTQIEINLGGINTMSVAEKGVVSLSLSGLVESTIDIFNLTGLAVTHRNCRVYKR